MKEIRCRYDHEWVIEKSRFIGIAVPLGHEADAKDILKTIQKEYPKATHYCYAYRCEGKEKSCDDGEPGGTAGRPMLEYLTRNGFTNVMVIAVRYFGGIKLGAGGLLRAYVETAKTAFSNAEFYESVTHQEYVLTMDYSCYDAVNRYLLGQSGKVESSDFGENVKITYLTPDLNEADLNNITNGKIQITFAQEKQVYLKVKE